jgi:hypothetical protein
VFQADRAILDSHEISLSAYALFSYFCKFGGRDNPTCTASLDRAAEDLKRDYTYLTRVRKELVAAGWIFIHKGTIYFLKGIEEYTESAQKLVSEVAKLATSSPKPERSKVAKTASQKLRKQQVRVAKTASQSCENSKSHIKGEPAQLTSPINQSATHTPRPRKLPDLSPERKAEITALHVFYCEQVETIQLDARSAGTLNRAIGERGFDFCRDVIRGCALDTWEDRKFNNSIQFIFEKPERMNRLAKIAEAKNGAGKGSASQNREQGKEQGSAGGDIRGRTAYDPFAGKPEI